VVFRVSGRIDGMSVEALQQSMEKEKTKRCRLTIDLGEVTLVNQEVVEALGVAGQNELKNCPAYVREWVSRANERHD